MVGLGTQPVAPPGDYVPWAAAASPGGAITVTSAATAPAQMVAPAFTDVAYETVTVLRGGAPNDGGSAITGYEMQYRATGGGEWTLIDPFNATADLSDLDSDTEYEAQQRAVNAIGAGPWSASGIFTTDQLPDAYGNGGGTVNIVVDDGSFTVTVSGSSLAHHNGTHGPFATALSVSAANRRLRCGRRSIADGSESDPRICTASA